MTDGGTVPDRTLASSFAIAADAYEHGRPSYPGPLLEWLAALVGLGPDTDALDPAAGTGKLTRELVHSGARLVAVEPLAEMRAVCARAVPQVPVVAATAESLPFGDSTQDVVFVAQAYHWFDRDAATTEIARVLRPGGHLVCLWNFEDVTEPWVAEVEAVKDGVSRNRRTLIGAAAWEFDLKAPSLFAGPGRRTERFTLPMTASALLAGFASRSYVLVLDPVARDAAVERVRAVIAGFDDPFPVPYRTEALWWRRLAPTHGGGTR